MVPVYSRARTAVRYAHLARPGGPACGAPAHSLLAVSAHGDDRLAWITCPDCRLLAEHGCEIPAVTAV